MRLELEQILFSQGFGTRYDCRSLVRSGQVKINQVVKTDPDETVETQNLKFEVRGQLWLYKEKAIIALNKPSGYECSQKPIHHPSVMTLLPSPLRRRGVQPVGRLDEDTTGLLILTDDGILQHRLIHPKKHVAKTYRVSCKHPCSDLFFDLWSLIRSSIHGGAIVARLEKRMWGGASIIRLRRHSWHL